jgi:hypothetical protein
MSSMTLRMMLPSCLSVRERSTTQDQFHTSRTRNGFSGMLRIRQRKTKPIAAAAVKHTTHRTNHAQSHVIVRLFLTVQGVNKTRGATSGPYQLPSGDWICFVSDTCSGPFQGAFKFAFSADGTQLEMGMPLKAFLNLQDGTPAVGIGSTLTVQFTLETSGQLSQPDDWVTDGSFTFPYHLDPLSVVENSLAWQIAVPIATFFVGVTIAAAITYCVMRRKGYESI